MKKDLFAIFAIRPITDKKRFYLLSFSWGLLMNLAGAMVAVFMLVTGHRMRRFGPCFYFEHGEGWGGMDWGCVIVVNKGAGSHLLSHELGHAMQNCRFGPFMPLLVGIPSALRYRFRQLYTRISGRQPKKPYDAIWFEGQATRIGQEYLKLTRS